MEKEELAEYIKDNLSIKIETREIGQNTTTIKVSLLISGELVNYDYILLENLRG